jgi:CMP-N-acetylneuraminic acid synthetase
MRANDGKAVAIIPARGGSKRLRGKNLLPFFGHPMIAYAISAAVNSELFEKVVVSTDDAEIGRVAQWYGAEYLERPPELATDEAKSIDAITHALRTLAKNGVEAEFLCQIFPNCPLLTSADIIDHWNKFRAADRNFQISVVPYRCVYPDWAMRVDADGRAEWAYTDRTGMRSQELAHTVCPTGAVWWARCAELQAKNNFYAPPICVAEIDANRGIDIDDEADLRLAELLVLGLTERDGRSPLEPARKSYLEREPSCLRA